MPCSTNQATADMILSTLEDFDYIDKYMSYQESKDLEYSMTGIYKNVRCVFFGPDGYTDGTEWIKINATTTLDFKMPFKEINEFRKRIVDYYMDCYINDLSIFNYIQYKLSTRPNRYRMEWYSSTPT